MSKTINSTRKRLKPRRKERVIHGYFDTSDDQSDYLESLESNESHIDRYFAARLADPKTVNNSLNKGSKTLPTSLKFIKFNKSKMTKYPEIETDNTTIYKSIFHMMSSLNTDQDCRNHLEELLWGGIPTCKHCGSQREDHYRIKSRGEHKGYYKCKDCRMPFSVLIGTMFDSSKISLKKWFMAIYIFSSHKKGISSHQLHRDLEVTQKTAWFMLSRIRESFGASEDFVFDGITQVDETYVGGKNKNRIKKKKLSRSQGRSLKGKVPVFGMLGDNGLVYAEVVPNVKAATLKDIIRPKVKDGSIIVSDGYKAYDSLWWRYKHVTINHSGGYFKNGPYHTNGIEGFWSHLKRGINGIYHSVSRKHLQRYCDEYAFRYNTRKMSEGERFNLSLINADEVLRYRDLIASQN